MTKEEKIERLKKEIDKLEKGIVKITPQAEKKKTYTPMRDAFEDRFSEYGPLPFAKAVLETDPPQIDSKVATYWNMMTKAGYFIFVGVVAAIETPILLGRTVAALFGGVAYKIGNVKIDKANEKLTKMLSTLEEKREVLNELIGLDNEERKLVQKEDEEQSELE